MRDLGVQVRHQGKSIAHKLALEFALNAGHRVLVCTRQGDTLRWRKKHLTVIQNVPRKKPQPLIIYDGDLTYE